MASIKEYVEYIVKMDNTSFKKGSKENETSNKNMESSITKSYKSVVAMGAATVGAAAGIFKMADMASDLNEAMNVIDVTFGDNADSVKAWSETSIEAMGISQTQALKTAGVYGAMGKSLGLTDTQVLKLATSLTQTSADLASFYNIRQDVAATALKGVFTGETESLKQLGIMIDENTLKQYGYNSNMSQAEKIMIRYKAVMDQTKDAQGDFERTSDSLANQTRILKEQIKQLGTEIGQKLIPVVNNIVHALNEGLAIAIALVSGELSGEMQTALTMFTTALTNAIPYLALIAGIFVAMVGPMEIIGIIWAALAPILTAVSGAFVAIGEAIALLLSPMGLLIIGIALLIGFVIQAGIQMGVWGEMLAAVGEQVKALFNFVKTLVVSIVTMIATVIQAIAQNAVFQAGIQLLAGAISKLITVTANLITIVVQQITKFIEWATQSAVVQGGLEALGNIVGFLAGVVTTLIGTVISVIAQFIEWLNESGLLQAALLLVETAVMAIVTVISVVLTAISSVIDAFTSWVESSGLVQTALDGIAAVIGTISSAIEWMNQKIQEAISWFANLASSAADAMSNIPVIGGLFKNSTTGASGQGAVYNNYYSFSVTPQDAGSYRSAYRSGIAMVQSQGGTL